ncbi:MAG: RagB/SusD family nutrient uptake outer membrane protein [Gemmatimonadetes bacterium]|nr:RagB/SusD family nutrient uptake outer membrane protein [Gemmatimonadota bacterium]
MTARNKLAASAVFMASTVMLSGCSLDDILAVHVPGKVLEEALDNAALADVLSTGVVAEVECSWNQYVAGAAHHSDEYVPTSGNLTMRNWGQRKIYASDSGYSQGTCGGWGYPMFTPLHTARFQSEDVASRLSGFPAEEVSNLAALQAKVATWGAFPVVAMGEGFCRMAINGGGALTPADVQAEAEQRFSTAISLAQAAGDQTLTMQGMLGRARVRIAKGDFSGALADAGQIPDGFVVEVTRDAAESRRYNYYFERLNAPTGFRAHGSVADNYQNLTIGADGMPTDGDGVKDTRVNVKTDGTQAADFATILYYHDKYNSRSDPLPLVHWHEARMYEAEALAMQGDVAGALGKINGLREAAGLPMVTAAVGAGDIMDLVKEERRRQLFVLGGHRLHDMLRFNVPFLGDPGSIHPDGRDQTGAEYGNLTCFQLPEVEVKGNENISS